MRSNGMVLSWMALAAAVVGFGGCGHSRGTDTTSGASRSQETAATCVSRTDIRGAGLTSGGVVGINERGQVAGNGKWGPDAVEHAFFWDGVTLFELGTLGGRDSSAQAMNDNGWVVGYSAVTGEIAPSRATLWRDGAIIDLGSLAEGKPSFASHVNDAGQVIGISTLANGDNRGWVWEDGVMKDVGTLGGRTSDTKDINDRGQIIGSAAVAGGAQHGFLWEKGVMTDLGTFQGTDINARGDILGRDGLRTYVRHADGTMTEVVPFAGATDTVARAMNDAAQVVGQTRLADGSLVSFLWQEGVPTKTIGSASPPDGLLAYALDASGRVIGTTAFSGPKVSGPERGFTWKDGDLVYLSTEAEATVADFIDNRNRIAGASVGANGLPIVWTLSACAEPDAGGAQEDGGSSSGGGGGDHGGDDAGTGKSW